MKRWVALFLTGILVCSWEIVGVAQTKPDTISARCALVMDAATGTVLFEKNADEKRPMASTTKIMTTLLALEKDVPQQPVVTTKEMVTVEGSGMGLLPGDTVTVEGLCYGMMLASGNDAANTIAIALSGSLPAFANAMNQKASAIGMRNTHFVTPSGLDAENHYSTAYDMALLMQYALKNPNFSAITAASSAAIYYGNPPYRRVLQNHHRLLKEYAGCIGGKTGFTKKAGRCLVTAAQRDGATLICVTLSAPDDWTDHKALLDYGFSQMESVTISSKPISIAVVGGTRQQVTALSSDLTISLPKTVASRVTLAYEAPRFIYAPVANQQPVGSVSLYLDEVLLQKTPLVTQDAILVSPYQPNFWQKVRRWWHRLIN